ncbi:MAG TPA: hypothetical protein VI583_07650, partial [Cyclobacteriaceae bacterium]|nr:hypothetical protein [Cyclobacteriaceae bacterium]
KHAEFMKKYFPGNTGLEDYINKEAKIMKDKIAGYAHNFREITVNDLVYFNDSLAQASLKKIVIPLYVSIMDTATMVPDRYYTSQLVLAPDSSILAVGNIKPGRGKGVIQTSLSRVKDSGDLLWVKNLTEVKPAGGIVCDMIGTLTVVPEGYAVVVNRYDMVSKEIGNFFMLIGDSGDTLVSFPVPIPGFPKKIMYSESDGSYLIITKGRGPIENISDDEPMEWIKINRDGGVIWKNRLSFAGDIKELIAMKTGHIIFGNFTRIKDTSGKVNVLTTTSGETAAYAIIIDEEGNASGIKCFNSIVPWQLLTARKISGDIICLLGKSGIYTTGIFEPIRGNSGLVQFIIDGNLDVLFEEKN